jgi:hypothetical protein
MNVFTFFFLCNSFTIFFFCNLALKHHASNKNEEDAILGSKALIEDIRSLNINDFIDSQGNKQ